MNKQIDKNEKFSSIQNDQSTCSEQISQDQFFLQLIQHNDIPTLKDHGIKTKNMNFLDSYPELNIDNKISPLVCAVHLGRLDIVKLLLDNPTIDLDFATEECGYTPLVIATMTGNYEILKLLLDYGAEVNQPTSQFQTPFTCCFQRLEEESNVFENRKICLKMAELCLHYGADIDWVVNKIKGYTLLMQLASIKMDLTDQEILINYEIIRFLLENGANTQIKTMKGKTLLDLTKKHPNKENIENLIKNSKQIYFYNQKPDLSKINDNDTLIENKQQKSKSMMQYLAFCKN